MLYADTWKTWVWILSVFIMQYYNHARRVW